MQILTHWLLELFAENAFLDILESFNQEMSHINNKNIIIIIINWIFY